MSIHTSLPMSFPLAILAALALAAAWVNATAEGTSPGFLRMVAIVLIWSGFAGAWIQQRGRGGRQGRLGADLMAIFAFAAAVAMVAG